VGFVVAASVLVASFVWSGRLILAPTELAEDASILAALGVLLLGIVSSLGIVLSRGQWTRYLALALVAALAVLGVFLPLDGWGWSTLVITAIALFLLVGPWLDGFLRRLPPADAPPPAATALGLGLVAAPLVVALAAPGGLHPLHWTAAGVCVGSGWFFARALPGAVLIVRTLPPVALAGAAAVNTAYGIVATGLLALSVTGLAWRRDASLAVNPLAPRPASGLSVPAELVPIELLAAAGYDERGRPKEST
jgi:hypothetical protein